MSKTLLGVVSGMVLSFVVLSGVAVLAYLEQVDRATDNATAHLQRVANGNGAVIKYWYAEGESDIRVLGSTSRVRTEFERYLQGDGAAEEWLRLRLEAERAARDYVNITLFDTSGKAQLVLGEDSPGHVQDLTMHAVEAAALTSGTVVASHPGEDGTYHVAWFAPLRIEEEPGHERTTGVVMFESDMKAYLQRVFAPIDDPWPTTLALRFEDRGDAYVADTSGDFSFRLLRNAEYPDVDGVSASAPIVNDSFAVVAWVARQDILDSLAWERWTIAGVDLLVFLTFASFVYAYIRSDANRRKEMRAKEALQDALDTQDRFLANVSHDLRTPLNSVIGFSGLLKQGLPGPLNAEQYRQVSMIEASGKHLLALVTDVLDLSKLKAGAEDVDPETVLAADLVAYVTERLAPQVAEKGLTWETSVPDGLELITDRHLAQRVLLNLGANAVKFTVNGGVKISVTRRPHNMIAFAVTDTGPGIAYGTHREIMREFRQMHSPGETKPEGSGLGLPISSKTAVLLGGEIEIDSTPGHGATFTFVLPADGAVL
jgi:signal transduction histidine kinase